jgi:hypothetical protein
MTREEREPELGRIVRSISRTKGSTEKGTQYHDQRSTKFLMTLLGLDLYGLTLYFLSNTLTYRKSFTIVIPQTTYITGILDFRNILSPPAKTSTPNNILPPLERNLHIE